MVVVYTILLVLGLLIVAALLIAALLPASYNIEKNIIINRPLGAVMEKVADLNYYAQWNPWQKSEPDSNQEITGTPMTRGHRYAWKGKKIGEGSLTLRDIDARHIHFDLEFIKPFKSSANDNWQFEEWGNSETKITWQNNGDLPYPMGRLMGPILNKTLQKQFEQGLLNLKALCEK
ncbi:MAG TPA: SRPBCC family protein [Pseudobacter sp.]|nr:SRPBCC family protein [Pseudobacter sp.]